MGKKITKDLIADLFRIILGVVFVFSGLMKILDPWGTAVVISDYLDVFKMSWLSGWSAALAVVLCAAEVVLGFMLLFKIGMRLVSILVMLAMTGFTILTLVIAIWNPLDNCGCFGDAIKIDNWHSFFKNLILWPMSIYLWYRCRGRKILSFSRREVVLTVAFAVCVAGLGVYSWRHLPLVEFFPYKVGTDLRTDVLCTRCMDRSLRVVYRDKVTGTEQPFELSDTTWYDESRWEYVRTTDDYTENPPAILDHDFAIWQDGYNKADEVIFREGETHMIMVRQLGTGIGNQCEARLHAYLEKLAAQGANMIVVVGVGPDKPVEYAIPATIQIGERVYPSAGMELALQKKLLRADVGEVLIKDGRIARKRTCWDLK